jgi:hypothetical protein
MGMPLRSDSRYEVSYHIMINLIPPNGAAALRYEYILRIVSVYGVILGGIFLASAALMVPTYVLTSAQLKTAHSNSEEMEKTKEAFAKAAGEIKQVNAVMSNLRFEENPVTYSEIIEEVVRSASEGITLSTFKASHEGETIRTVVVQGVASNRRSLARFKDALEASLLFEKAELPISDLARDTNLPFVVTLTMGGPKTP